MINDKEIFLAKREVCRKLLRDIDQAIDVGNDPRTDETVLYWLDVMRHQPQHDPEWAKIEVIRGVDMIYPEELMIEREFDFFRLQKKS